MDQKTCCPRLRDGLGRYALGSASSCRRHHVGEGSRGELLDAVFRVAWVRHEHPTTQGRLQRQGRDTTRLFTRGLG